MTPTPKPPSIVERIIAFAEREGRDAGRIGFLNDDGHGTARVVDLGAELAALREHVELLESTSRIFIEGLLRGTTQDLPTVARALEQVLSKKPTALEPQP